MQLEEISAWNIKDHVNQVTVIFKLKNDAILILQRVTRCQS